MSLRWPATNRRHCSRAGEHGAVRGVSSIRSKSEALSRFPHTPMIVWHCGVGQAEMGKGVVDRIGEGGDAADVRRLADSLRTDRMMRRRGGRIIGLPSRRLDRSRQEEIEQTGVLQIAVFVIVHFLAHGDGERLG